MENNYLTIKEYELIFSVIKEFRKLKNKYPDELNENSWPEAEKTIKDIEIYFEEFIETIYVDYDGDIYLDKPNYAIIATTYNYIGFIVKSKNYKFSLLIDYIKESIKIMKFVEDFETRLTIEFFRD